MNPSLQDTIWNRAALDGGGSSPRVADSALASLLLAHGLVMNGGVVHALGILSKMELDAAISGFGYFGLSAAESVLSQAADDTDATEERLNFAYSRAIPDDQTIEQAFRLKFVANPQAFSPLD